MAPIPTLYTPRLKLRPFDPADAPRVRELAGDRRIAAMTSRIPHPYPEDAAEAWIHSLQPAADAGKSFVFAITLAGTRTPGREFDLADTGHLIGSIGLDMEGAPESQRGALGYWIGAPYWNKGFATEAARAVLDFGFGRCGLHRIEARHFGANPASGRVMIKLGMVREGALRSYECKWGEFLDVVVYGLLRDEWLRLRRAHRLVPRHAELLPA